MPERCLRTEKHVLKSVSVRVLLAYPYRAFLLLLSRRTKSVDSYETPIFCIRFFAGEGKPQTANLGKYISRTSYKNFYHYLCKEILCQCKGSYRSHGSCHINGIIFAKFYHQISTLHVNCHFFIYQTHTSCSRCSSTGTGTGS